MGDATTLSEARLLTARALQTREAVRFFGKLARSRDYRDQSVAVYNALAALRARHGEEALRGTSLGSPATSWLYTYRERLHHYAATGFFTVPMSAIDENAARSDADTTTDDLGVRTARLVAHAQWRAIANVALLKHKLSLHRVAEHTLHDGRPMSFPATAFNAIFEHCYLPYGDLLTFNKTATPIAMRGPGLHGGVLALSTARMKRAEWAALVTLRCGHRGLLLYPYAPLLTREERTRQLAAIAKEAPLCRACPTSEMGMGARADPFHVLTECQHTAIIRERGDPGRIAYTTLTTLADYGLRISRTVREKMYSLPPNAWDSRPGRLLLFWCLAVVPWSHTLVEKFAECDPDRSANDTLWTLAHDVGKVFRETVHKPHRLRKAITSWVQLSGTRCAAIAKAWAEATSLPPPAAGPAIDTDARTRGPRRPTGRPTRRPAASGAPRRPTSPPPRRSRKQATARPRRRREECEMSDSTSSGSFDEELLDADTVDTPSDDSS